MNSVLSFFEKQQGISNSLTYDFALSRLCVPRQDSWKGITPSTYGSDYNPEPPIFSAKFANCASYKHILAIANEDGKIALQDTTQSNTASEEKALEGQQCHYNAVFDLEWTPGQMKFVSASGDHTARLWDITESKIELNRIFNGHTRSVKTAAFRKRDSSVFATGGRDGAILIWDTRASLNVDLTPRADNCIYSGHAGGPGTPISQKKKARTPKCGTTYTTSSITGLVFQDDMTLVSCGSGDGVIKVWDLRRNYTSYKKEPLPKHSLPYAGSSTLKGFTNLLVDEGGVKLYANCMDNTIYCYNLTSYSTNPIERYVGFRNGTFYIKSCLSPDGNYLVSGSSDERAYIWNVRNSKPVVALVGHAVEVTCVAWSAANDMPIVTCSDDAQHKIWRIGPEKIGIDEKINYRGHAEYCKGYQNYIFKNHLKFLECTPRSLRRIIEQNEKTPSSVEKVSMKRSFAEMNCGNSCEGSDQKRPHLETRGRRLFSPSTSYSARCTMEREIKSLSSVLEETDSNISLVVNHPEDSNQENSLKDQQPYTVSCSSVNNKVVSPLTERVNFNLNSSLLSSQRPSTSSATIFSPTSNLPNYVLDGEAPHLHIMSPKRKFKDKIDWLTKIRKQKLMSTRGNISDKINGTQNFESNNFLNHETACLSPRLQSLKNSESSGRSPGAPKRRISHSGQHVDGPSQAKIPTPTRRNSETSILRFFTITTQSQSQNNQHREISNLAAASCSNGSL